MINEMLKIHKKLPEREDEQLKMVFNEFTENSKSLGIQFFKTVHLYNHINTQFESLKEFHKIEDQFRKELAEEIENILNNVKDIQGQTADEFLKKYMQGTDTGENALKYEDQKEDQN